MAKRLGPPAAVALAGLLGLVAAALLATDWIRRHAELLARLDGPQLTSHEHEPGPAELTSRRPSPPTHTARIAGQPDLPDGSLGASAQLLSRQDQLLSRRHAHRAPRDVATSATCPARPG